MSFLKKTTILGLAPSKKKAPSLPSLGPQGLQFQSEMYPLLGQALGGGGLYQQFRYQTFGDVLDALREEGPRIKEQTLGMLNRMVPRSDETVREAVTNEMTASRARTREAARESLLGPQAKEAERFEALDMALGNLGSEVGLAEQLGGMDYQAMMQAYTSPTFLGRLGAGLGSAAGWYSVMGQGGQTPPPSSPSLSNAPAVIEFSEQMSRYGDRLPPQRPLGLAPQY